MIVWLWDSSSAGGVSDDDTQAREIAEVFMQSSGARTARVEQARLMLGYDWMTSGYLRLGYGWSAVRRDSDIKWVTLAARDVPKHESSFMAAHPEAHAQIRERQSCHDTGRLRDRPGRPRSL